VFPRVPTLTAVAVLLTAKPLSVSVLSVNVDGSVLRVTAPVKAVVVLAKMVTVAVLALTGTPPVQFPAVGLGAIGPVRSVTPGTHKTPGK